MGLVSNACIEIGTWKGVKGLIMGLAYAQAKF